MAIYLTEREVTEILTMEDALQAVEEAFRAKAERRADHRSRERLRGDGTVLSVMPASLPDGGVMGLKAYASGGGGSQFVVLLFDARSAELLAVLEADRLGQMRTGAASGLATRLMARPEADQLAVLGAGWQARSQVEAVLAVRPIRMVRIYSPSADRRERMAAEVRERHGVEAVAEESAEAAVRGADVVVTATTAVDPVLLGRWLKPGAHVNAVGSNRADHAEVDAEALERAAVVAVDDLEQARREAGDFLRAFGPDGDGWKRVVELADILAGRASGRPSAEAVTLFESLGLGLEDVATAARVYRKATALGAGRRLD
ncbi:MAG: ornithine cyclodeaminase family protein [Clostridia bacterium]|nr:ornithine cyclodeaminase family protein [Clostridia bacterium]MCL6520763.1 ornithine cyclodeaminase family protein [Bacillota bacterium]